MYQERSALAGAVYVSIVEDFDLGWSSMEKRIIDAP
jgi:hypothetical protein